MVLSLIQASHTGAFKPWPQMQGWAVPGDAGEQGPEAVVWGLLLGVHPLCSPWVLSLSARRRGDIWGRDRGTWVSLGLSQRDSWSINERALGLGALV